jgi:tRNA G10  N-methylase Trm11
MQIGMMPAKLTQLLVNIGVSYSKKQENVTVYDPFCGFGTTLWVANTLGYNAIGSDINASLAKKNLTRWKETEHADADARLMLYKHDVLEPFTK